MVKFLDSIRNFRDRIRTSISMKTSNVLIFVALILVVTLSILVRLSPLMRGLYLIKAFDPWIQWYNAEYLSTHSLYEYFHWVDTKSWYPEGYFRGALRPGLTFTVVGIYHIFNFLGLPVSLYDICFYFPAFMGGITILVIYFLGKEVLNRGTGLFAAFFLAFSPGYLQRTTAGFFDNETIGVFACLMAFLFFIKAVKTGKFTHAVIGGIFLGYLSLSWGGYQFVFLTIPIICLILILTKKYNENILISYAGVQGTGLLIFSLFSRFNYENLFSDLDIGGIFLLTIVLIIFHLIYSKKNDHPKLYEGLINLVKWGLIPVIVIFAVIIWVAPEILPFGFGSRFWTIINPLFREDVSLVASVAEQMPSAWAVFYYNTMIPMIVVPLGVYFCFKRLNVGDLFIIIFIILMYYFTGSMIRIILIFAPAAALAGAYGLASVLKIFGSFVGEQKAYTSRKRRRQVKGTIGSSETFGVYLIVGLLCIAQVVHGTNVAIQQMSFAQMRPGGYTDWEETLTWMRTNLDGTDVVASWWDYGYWLTPVGNVTSVNDNATMNSTRIGLTGMALMQSNELYSAKAFRRLNADYVLVYFGFLVTGFGGDEGKWTWMIEICNDHYNTYKRNGWEEDNWVENAVFDMDDYINQVQNTTYGYYKDAWFDTQLTKLMFYEEPTEPETATDDFEGYYANQINQRVDNDGKSWATHIPYNGQYDSQIFVKEHFSPNGLIKLYRIDYTVLDSSFIIENAEVYDNGYAKFNLKNTGIKDLEITNVKINGEGYDYVMNGVNNTVSSESEDLVYVDMSSAGTPLQKDDVVRINVTAKSEALYDRVYTFTNATSNFFVKDAIPGQIKINKENSKVIQINETAVDIYLEVENEGDSVLAIDRFYLNNDTVENRINSPIEILDGHPVLAPGEKVNLYLADAIANFSPIKTYNRIGVATFNNVSSEVLFTSNIENYALSILDEGRIQSPEALAALNSNFRNHIPIDFDNSYAYTYNDGSTILNISIKNTGDVIYGLESIYLTESLDPVDLNDFYPQSGNYNLEVDEEENIIVNATDYINGEINEEILVCITGNYVGTVASDIGYIHTINDDPDIELIENIEGITTSFIYANETGKLLVKNTGDESVIINNLYINSTQIDNFNYAYGSSTLDIQECVILTFDIPGLMINDSDEVEVQITTNSTAQVLETLNATVDSTYYNILIDDVGTIADDSANLTIAIENHGLFNVTLDSVYINNTYFSIDEFYSGNGYDVGSGDSLTLTIDMALVEAKLGTLNAGDTLEILVISIEGAEDIHLEDVVP